MQRKAQEMNSTANDRLLSFLGELESTRISYTLGHIRTEAILVSVAVPGERWEVEFLEDGSVDVERFVSTGCLGDDSALADLFERHRG